MTGGRTELHMLGWLCACCNKPLRFCKSASHGWKAATLISAKAFLVEENCAVTRISLKAVNAWQTLSYCHLQSEWAHKEAAQKLAVTLYGDAKAL